MTRQKISDFLLRITAIIALGVSVGALIMAVMMPLNAHAGIIFIGRVPIITGTIHAAPKTAVPVASGLTVVPTQPASASSAVSAPSSTSDISVGWICAILFLLPMATYGAFWCWFGDHK